MCIATKLLNELESTVEKINVEWERLIKLQSQLDVEVSNQYHKIEQGNFNAAEGYYLARELQVLLRKRRVVKDELFTLRRIRSHLDVKMFEETIPKAKKSLNDIHNNRKNSEWKKGWKDHFRAEEMVLQ